MRTSNVLVTCGGRWVGLILQLRRAMQQVPQLRRGRLLVGDCARLTPAGSFADAAVTVPCADDANYIDRLLSICRQEGVRVLLPHTDIDLGRLSHHIDDFRQIGTTLVCPSPEVVELCSDKLRFEEFAVSEGLALPRSYRLEAVTAASLPLFAKRRRGWGSEGATVCRTMAEARAAARRLPDAIFQSFIEAEEVSVDAFIGRSGRCVVRVPRVRDKVFDGEAMQSHTIRQPRVTELADRTIAALARRGLRGPLNVQLFAGQLPTLIEVNPRLGSASVLSNMATDGRFYASILEEACGGAVDGDPDDYRDDLALYRFFGDVFYDRSSSVCVLPQDGEVGRNGRKYNGNGNAKGSTATAANGMLPATPSSATGSCTPRAGGAPNGTR